MLKLNQSGASTGLVISLVFVVILLVGALGFAGWAFSSRQDYKNHSDAKVATAIKSADKQQSAIDASQAAEVAKQPLTLYRGPEAFGSLLIYYPKTWSGYVDDTGQNNGPVDGYFAPGVVPSINNQSSVFALRVQVLSNAYSQTLQALQGQQQNGQVTISAYSLPKLPKVVGVEVTGQLSDGGPNTTMVVLPLRSQTLEISTQGNQYLNDFNNNILPHFSFSP